MRRENDHHPLLDLIQQLYNARELVVDAYERSGVDLDDKAMRQLEPLMKTHLLRREGASGIRLNQKLQKVFDSALRKDRIAAINTDLNSELQAAELAMRQLQDVKMQGRFDEMLAARDDVEQHLLSIYDILDDSSTTIFNRVTSSYGIRSNPEIRSRENEMYSRQLSNLVESYNQMRSSLSDEPFSLDPEISAFIANLDIRCMEVVDRIRRTQNTIRDNLFRVRALEERARKIRAVADHLRHNPGFEALRTQDALESHPFFRAIESIRVQASPDLTDIGVDEGCADLVAKLSQTLKYETPKTTRADSTLKDGGQPERTIQVSARDKMVKRLLSSCIEQGEPISALTFWRTQWREPALEDLEDREWLYAVALYMDGDPQLPNRKKTSDYARLHIHALPTHPLSGTYSLVDLYIYPAGTPLETVKALATRAKVEAETA
ncbi:hypothetical protein [Marinobacter shengliensis]|uniref:hypothetical protein n=1 Tax=Marinobacter shengliensis TaxID=1389223 RepID=UPI001107D97C|nr:hypothetical protein [Marinobacter shengliensis]